jgi:transposase
VLSGDSADGLVGVGVHQNLMGIRLAGRQSGSRTYPLAYKRQVVAETMAGDRSVAAVAREHGLNANMVFSWRRDPRFRLPARLSAEAAAFLPVELTDVPSVVEGEAERSALEGGEIELVLRQGHRLLLRGRFDVDAVLQLVRALARV